MAWFASLKLWAKELKRDVGALWRASRDPRVPWLAKAVAAAVAAYALSPIDLIPDFIPVLGYVDDLVLLPLGVMLAAKLVPSEIMAEHRAAAIAAETTGGGRAAAAVVVCLWAAGAGLLLWSFWPTTAL